MNEKPFQPEPAKKPSASEFAEFIVGGFRQKPWLADEWRASGSDLKSYSAYEVEAQNAMVSFKIGRDFFSEAERAGICDLVLKGISGITLKLTGPLIPDA
jgi:hypothetical protein